MVEWLDSGRVDGWEDAQDAVRSALDDPLVCHSVGWLMHEDEQRIIVVPTRKFPFRPGTGELLSKLVIPSCAVLSMRALTVGRKRR